MKNSAAVCFATALIVFCLFAGGAAATANAQETPGADTDKFLNK